MTLVPSGILLWIQLRSMPVAWLMLNPLSVKILKLFPHELLLIHISLKSYLSNWLFEPKLPKEPLLGSSYSLEFDTGLFLSQRKMLWLQEGGSVESGNPTTIWTNIKVSRVFANYTFISLFRDPATENQTFLKKEFIAIDDNAEVFIFSLLKGPFS